MRKPLTTLLLLTALAAIAGCQNAGVVTGGAQALQGDEDSAIFIDRVASLENVSENDAMRGVLLLLDGEDTAQTFQQRVDLMLQRHLVSPNWDFSADRPITRGRLAYMICQATDMPGGIILTLTGPSQRYCHRELQYRGMMTSGAIFSPVGGLEYVSVLTRADTFIRTGEVPDKAGAIREY